MLIWSQFRCKLTPQLFFFFLCHWPQKISLNFSPWEPFALHGQLATQPSQQSHPYHPIVNIYICLFCFKTFNFYSNSKVGNIYLKIQVIQGSRDIINYLEPWFINHCILKNGSPQLLFLTVNLNHQELEIYFQSLFSSPFYIKLFKVRLKEYCFCH